MISLYILYQHISAMFDYRETSAKLSRPAQSTHAKNSCAQVLTESGSRRCSTCHFFWFWQNLQTSLATMTLWHHEQQKSCRISHRSRRPKWEAMKPRGSPGRFAWQHLGGETKLGQLVAVPSVTFMMAWVEKALNLMVLRQSVLWSTIQDFIIDLFWALVINNFVF